MNSRSNRERKILYIRQSLASLADNLSAPYIGYYFASLSGSGALQGLLQLSVNSLPTITQVFAGSWLDRTRRHVTLLLATSIAASLLWLVIPLTLNPYALVGLITARALAVGVAGLALTALIAEIFGSGERGSILSNVNFAAQLVALPVFALTFSWNPNLETLRFIFIISGLISLTASLTWISMLSIEQRIRRQTTQLSLLATSKVFKDKTFTTFVAANSAYSFAMAVAWPLFPLAQSYVFLMKISDLALLNILSSSTTMISQYALAKRINGDNLKTLIVFSRAGLVMFPTVYMLAHDPLPIFVWQALSGPFVAIGSVAIPLYAMETADPELKASCLSYLNLFQGVSASLGSAVGGFVADKLIAMKGWEGIRYGFALSATLRMVALLPFLKIKKLQSIQGKH